METCTKVPDNCWGQVMCHKVQLSDRPLQNMVKVKPKLHWKLQDIGDARIMGCGVELVKER